LAVGAACAVLAPLALKNSKDKQWREKVSTAEKMMGTTVRAVTSSVMNGSTVSLATTSQVAASTTTVETEKITQDYVCQSTSVAAAAPPPPYAAPDTEKELPEATPQPKSEIVQLIEKLSDSEKMTLLKLLKATESGTKTDDSTLQQTVSNSGAASSDSANSTSLTQTATTTTTTSTTTTAQVGNPAAGALGNIMKTSWNRQRLQRQDSTQVSLNFSDWSTSLNASSTAAGTPSLSLKIDKRTASAESSSAATTETASVLSPFLSSRHKSAYTTLQSRSVQSFLAATTKPEFPRRHAPVPLTAGLLTPSYLGTSYFSPLGTGTVGGPNLKGLEFPVGAQGRITDEIN
jgi:hypothetical protein